MTNIGEASAWDVLHLLLHCTSRSMDVYTIDPGYRGSLRVRAY